MKYRGTEERRRTARGRRALCVRDELVNRVRSTGVGDEDHSLRYAVTSATIHRPARVQSTVPPSEPELSTHTSTVIVLLAVKVDGHGVVDRHRVRREGYDRVVGNRQESTVDASGKERTRHRKALTLRD